MWGLSYVTIATIGNAVDFGGKLDECISDVGIHPIVATMELNKHMQKVSQLIDGNEKLGVTYDCHDEMVAFLLEMADKYADSCLKVLKQKGMEASWFDEDSSFKTRNKGASFTGDINNLINAML